MALHLATAPLIRTTPSSLPYANALSPRSAKPPPLNPSLPSGTNKKGLRQAYIYSNSLRRVVAMATATEKETRAETNAPSSSSSSRPYQRSGKLKDALKSNNFSFVGTRFHSFCSLISDPVSKYILIMEKGSVSFRLELARRFSWYRISSSVCTKTSLYLYIYKPFLHLKKDLHVLKPIFMIIWSILHRSGLIADFASATVSGFLKTSFFTSKRENFMT